MALHAEVLAFVIAGNCQMGRGAAVCMRGESAKLRGRQGAAESRYERISGCGRPCRFSAGGLRSSEAFSFVTHRKKQAFQLITRTPQFLLLFFDSPRFPFEFADGVEFLGSRAGRSCQRWSAQSLRRVAEVQAVRVVNSIHYREGHQCRLPAKMMAYQIQSSRSFPRLPRSRGTTAGRC